MRIGHRIGSPGLIAVLWLLTTGLATADRLTLPLVRDAAVLERLVIRVGHAAMPSLAVSDLSLDVIIGAGGLAAPNVTRQKPFHTKFVTNLLIVANGRLLRDGYGLCSDWKDDISVCTVECDGGHFLLKRGAGHITLVLSRLPRLIEGDQSAAIRVGECGEGGEIVLDTADGDKAELVFGYGQ